MSTTELPLPATVPDIARRCGVTVRQVDYAVRSRGIRPTAWVGAARVYDGAAVEAVAAAVAEASTRKAPGRAASGPPAR